MPASGLSKGLRSFSLRTWENKQKSQSVDFVSHVRAGV